MLDAGKTRLRRQTQAAQPGGHVGRRTGLRHRRQGRRHDDARRRVTDGRRVAAHATAPGDEYLDCAIGTVSHPADLVAQGITIRDGQGQRDAVTPQRVELVAPP